MYEYPRIINIIQNVLYSSIISTLIIIIVYPVTPLNITIVFISYVVSLQFDSIVLLSFIQNLILKSYTN